MKIQTLILLFFATTAINAQDLMKFSVSINELAINTPIGVSLNGTPINNISGTPVLYEITKEGEKYIPSQVENAYNPTLWFILSPSESGITRNFILKMEDGSEKDKQQGKLSLDNNRYSLRLQKNNEPVLEYRYATKFPPENINPLYKRSGYIHPLWSPEGFNLTHIQPPDHFHHYGIWGPWTKTYIEGREVDFWNLAKGQGTVQFSNFISEYEGPVFAGFQALQEHIDFGARGEDQIALNEVLEVRVWNMENDIWMIDYTTNLNSPLKNGILFDAYRYGGGLGYRSTEKWHKDNCTVLTSEGKTRKDADGSNARWCIIEGESNSESGRSGILFLSHPTNRMHPEPMRVWPEDAAGGRGDMFFEFTPIRHESWKIEPKQNYSLKYRMIVFDGEMSAEKAEEYWKGFAGKGMGINVEMR